MKKDQNKFSPHEDARIQPSEVEGQNDGSLIVESLLQQMSLEKPSAELDQSVYSLIRSRNPDKAEAAEVAPRSAAGWFGAAISRCLSAESVGIAIAAMLFGVLLGSYLPGIISGLDAYRETVVVNPQQRPVVYDKGFVLVDGKKPSRIFVVEHSRVRSQTDGLPVRKEVVVPSIEF